MNKECFKEEFSALKDERSAVLLEAAVKMHSTKTGIVFQGWKRYVEAEEEE